MVGTSDKMPDEPQSNHKPRREGYSLRRHTIRPLWPNAIFENFYECASDDPSILQVWCYTDRLSYAPGDTVQFHVSTTAERFDLEIARDGVRRTAVFSKLDIPGTHHITPEDCSVHGCGWACTFKCTIPAEWRSGGYIITTRAKDTGSNASGAEVEHHHIMIVRASESKNAPLLLIAATSTTANEWGGSNHYEGITGPERDQFSPILSLERPFSRGFVVLPEGAPVSRSKSRRHLGQLRAIRTWNGLTQMAIAKNMPPQGGPAMSAILCVGPKPTATNLILLHNKISIWALSSLNAIVAL